MNIFETPLQKKLFYIPIALILFIPIASEIYYPSEQKYQDIYNYCMESRNNTGIENLTAEEGMGLANICESRATVESQLPWFPAILLALLWFFFIGPFFVPFVEIFLIPLFKKSSQNTKSQENLKKAKSILQSQTYDKENITISSKREIVKVNTDGPYGYHSKEKDVAFRYRNCMDIIQKNHVSKGDITDFFIYFGKGYLQFKDSYPNITKEEAITILKWPIPLLNKIYKTEKEKATSLKKKEQIQDLIKKIHKVS